MGRERIKLLGARLDRSGTCYVRRPHVAAPDCYEPEVERLGGLSAENGASHLEVLHDHLDLAEYGGHEFGDYSALATATFSEILATTRAAASRFFQDRGRLLHPFSQPRSAGYSKAGEVVRPHLRGHFAADLLELGEMIGRVEGLDVLGADVA